MAYKDKESYYGTSNHYDEYKAVLDIQRMEDALRDYEKRAQEAEENKRIRSECHNISGPLAELINNLG